MQRSSPSLHAALWPAMMGKPKMQHTAIGAALVRAGVDADQIRLRRAACDCFDRAKGNPDRAASLLAQMVARDASLLVAMFTRSQIEDRAVELIALINSNGDGHRRRAGQARLLMPTPLEPNAVSEGRSIVARKAEHGMPSETTPLRSDDGQSSRASQADAPVPSSDHPVAAGGQHDRATQAGVFLPPAARRTPNPPRGLDAIARVQPTMAKSIMDTFRIRDGRPIGDVSWGEIGGLIADNDREARVLRAVRMHIAEAPSDALIRDIVRASVIETALTKVPENV